ncbi:MerR family transcriptional regulator [Hamadaea sp. NPDC051192]|uniref:MerR family transcriptional regulator n=1 Tax=Hamadaea sp. NPDC051192 TaxID=3154940 RepID=UPI0034151698
MLTIGEFSRAARLSPRALRLYDKLGLLPPEVVDAETGYRYYHPEQLDRGRLIAWLRRLGMPLDVIRVVCDATPDAAAKEIERYRAVIASEAATRDRVATFLVDHFSGRAEPMPTPLTIQYAARTEPGVGRDTNEDTAYADDRLLAVADGMRGAAGARASAAAIEALRDLPSGDLIPALAAAVDRAQARLTEIAADDPSGQAVTTLTALVWSGSQLGLAHIGDTRVYLLRDGQLFQLTHDHSYVQSLVDSGRLTDDEAMAHPQRAQLIRALTNEGAAEPDLSVREARAGDRYLLCTDGLFAVVDKDAIRTSLARSVGAGEVVDDLIARAYAAGAPDNVACVVADVVPA